MLIRSKQTLLKSVTPYWPFFLLLILLPYVDFLLQFKVFRFMDYGADSTLGETPHLIGLRSLIFEEGFPSWTFRFGLGAPLESLAMFVFDPFNWLFAPFRGASVPFLIIYVHVLKVVLCLYFFERYLRERGFSRYSCAIGAMVYTFAGYSVLWGTFLPWSTALVFTSLALWGVERGFNKNKWTVFLCSILLFGFCGIYFLYMFSIYLALYFICRNIDEIKPSINPFVPRVGKGALAYLFGLGLAGFFVIPTLLNLLASPRIGHAEVPLFSTFQVYYYVSLVGRFFANSISYGTCANYGSAPYYEWGSNYYNMPATYCGLFCLLLAPQALLKPSRIHRKSFIVLGCLLVISFFSPFLSYVFHGFSYVSARWAFIYVAFVAYFTAETIHQWETKTSELNPKLLVATTLALLLVLVATIMAGSGVYSCQTRNVLHLISSNWTLFFFLILQAVVIALTFGERPHKYARILLLLTITLELAHFGRIDTVDRKLAPASMFRPGGSFYDGTPDVIQKIRANDRSFYRLMKSYYNTGFNDPVYMGFPGVTFYCSNNPPGLISFNGLLYGSAESEVNNALVVTPKHEAALNLAAVKYYLSKGPASDPFGSFVPFGFEKTSRQGNIDIYENAYHIPGGLLYDKFLDPEDLKPIEIPLQAQTLMDAFLYKGDPQKIPGIQHAAPRPSSVESHLSNIRRQGRGVKLNQESPTRLTANFNTTKPAVLVASITYHPDWRAVLDGKPVPAFDANSGLVGIWADAGEHEVIFEYQGTARRLGLWISLTFGCLLLFFWWRKRRGHFRDSL